MDASRTGSDASPPGRRSRRMGRPPAIEVGRRPDPRTATRRRAPPDRGRTRTRPSPTRTRPRRRRTRPPTPRNAGRPRLPEAMTTHGYPADPLGNAYPSAHTAAVVGAVSALWPWMRWPQRIVDLVFAVLVGCNRIYIGAHWPDVLGGAAIGLLSGTLTWLLATRWPLQRAGEPHRPGGRHPDHPRTAHALSTKCPRRRRV